jgi:hemerythrin
MALRWSSALATGVSEIDAQHVELFERFDQLLDAMIAKDRDGAARLIPFLQSHVREHLAAEERLMRELAYPDEAAHAAEHAAFAAEIEDLARQLEERGPTARLVLRLEVELTGWLRDHLYAADAALARFVLSRRWADGRPEGAPADG